MHPTHAHLSIDVVAPVEREIRALAAALTSVKDEQEYVMVRERRHRNTAESTNGRVKWWSIIQAIVLFCVVGWQVYYLKVSWILLHLVDYR
jgi:p24 family protein beta-1